MLDADGDGAGLVELGEPVPVVEVGRARGRCAARPRCELGVAVGRPSGGASTPGESGASGSSCTARRSVAHAGGACQPNSAHEPRDVVAVARVVDRCSTRPRCAWCRARRRWGGRSIDAGVRAAGPVRPGRVELADDARQQVEVVAARPRCGRRAARCQPQSNAAPDVLVVAVPQHQARVRHQPGDVLARLGLDLGGERLLLRVGGAGEQEVLPDQQAELVGRVVEVVALVQAAAPHPQQVDVGVDGLVEPRGVAVAGDAGREAVVGDPVDAADEDRHAVDDEGERGAVRSSGVVSSSTVRKPTRRDQPSSARLEPSDSVDRQVVQRLLAVPARPPQPRASRDRRRRGQRGRSPPGRDRPRSRPRRPATSSAHASRRLSRPGSTLDVHARPGRVHVRPSTVDQRTDRGQPGAAQACSPIGLPDAGGDQRRAPVPAEVAGHLADEVERLAGTAFGPRRRARPAAPRRSAYAEANAHRQRRCAPSRSSARDVEPVAAVHVRGAADLDAVERRPWPPCPARRRPGRPGRLVRRSSRTWSSYPQSVRPIQASAVSLSSR